MSFTTKILLIILCILSFASCSDKELTPQMKTDAEMSIYSYLQSNGLPKEGLRSFNLGTDSDFSYLYTGGGRCIGFVITCYGNQCNTLEKYPYDRHREICPIER